MAAIPPVVHIVDDDVPFLTATERLLRAANYTVRTYSNAGDFLLSRHDEGPGCVLLDLRLPGPSGLHLQQAIANQTEPLPIIFLSGCGDVPSAVRALKAGAMDFLTKPVKGEILLDAIDRALVRDTEMRALRKEVRRWHSCYTTLTEREALIFHEVVSGKMNKEIAVEMGSSERTIKAHRANVMRKMHASCFAELVHISECLSAHPALPQAAALR